MIRAIVALLALAGCTVGTELADFRPAHSPAGIQARVTIHPKLIDGNRIAGELLALRDDGLLILSPEPVLPNTGGERLVLVPYWMMQRIKLEQVGSFAVKSAGKELDEQRKKRLQLLSRYPQGVSDELLQSLLNSYDQAALDVPARAD